MDLEIIGTAKKAEDIKSDCCPADIWAVDFPDA